jgi:hypothetical protein
LNSCHLEVGWQHRPKKIRRSYHARPLSVAAIWLSNIVGRDILLPVV